jgi:hypothetical protein
VWDAFGIADAHMDGWWDPATPVRTGRDDVLATTYLGAGRALIALASWAGDTTWIGLQVDWKRLGLDPARARLRAPVIEGFQPGATFQPGDSIPVPSGKGWLLVAEEAP